MQSLIKIARKDLSAGWLLVSDVDDTFLGDDVALTTFAQELQANRENIIFALNSSRPCASLRRSIRQNPFIPLLDFIIGALGTEIESGSAGPPI